MYTNKSNAYAGLSSKKNSTLKKNSPIKKFCKVCADSKKSHDVVISHNVKDLITGVVTCPTLLEQPCRYCGETGHTISFCSRKKQNDKWDDHEAKRQKYEESQVATKMKETKTSKSVFDALMSDSEDEEEAEVIEEEVFIPKPLLLSGYSDALLSNPLVNSVRPIVLKKVKRVIDPTIKINWATAESDSSGDEEEF